MCLFGADGLDGRSKGVLCVCCYDGGAVHRNPMCTINVPRVGSEVHTWGMAWFGGDYWPRYL